MPAFFVHNKLSTAAVYYQNNYYDHIKFLYKITLDISHDTGQNDFKKTSKRFESYHIGLKLL